MPLVVLGIADPVLDGADGRHLLAEPQQRLLRIALAGRQRILEHDERQVGRVGDALEMRERHRGRLPEREGCRRKHQERGGAAVSRHARDARGLHAAVRPDAIHQGQAVADLVLGDIEHAALLVDAAGGDFGRMRVDGDRGDALDPRDVAQMLSESRLVDGEIGIEGQQDRGNDAARRVGPMACHGLPQGLKHAEPDGG
jgi:hypothetical protein